MNYQIISIIFLCAIKICFCSHCKPNQIYSLIDQSCHQCSNSCNTCFNTSESACVTCEDNLFKSSDDSSTCVQKCSKDEFLNENLECMKCQVYGCAKCDTSQICNQCDQQFNLDRANNQCILMNNVCPFQTDFIQGPSNLKQCNQECPQSFYQNMEAQICEETVKCIQIEESQRFSFTQRVKQIQPINEDQYLVEGNACTFALVDNNWKVINIQILQNITNYDQIYTFGGIETNNESFIIGNQGGCVSGSKLLVMNFQTFEVVFESITTFDYFVKYVDQKNQIVFMLSYYSDNLLWYDAINKSLNQYQIDITQYNDFFILTSVSPALVSYSLEIIKIDIKQDLISLVQVIQQFDGLSLKLCKLFQTIRLIIYNQHINNNKYDNSYGLKSNGCLRYSNSFSVQ
ncbi:zinc finger protein (macronuclear) [Tetrahymena thermophila SB210]|uniref:Zinc finger protein n=1 Tax=Tetrahymena thermophila (strain SB210) TaxID=312017 RepID=Q23T93_TETTS|nr:zinc finger protein [Tetrahymena thermophila SB210]EAR99813.3 zinc finger protein [Tetrahymena thermophila SB210]|eukprot:XP_001020058.3 zinc finger protein [Tetrahymena thermophila SB210]